MPTTYTDQFWAIDPSAPPPVGTTLNTQFLSIVDQNNNGLINRSNNDSIDGSDIRSSYSGDTLTVIDKDGVTVTITGTTFYLRDGRVLFTPEDGSKLTTSTYQSSSWVSGQGSLPVSGPGGLGPPCFTPQTRILTAAGPKAVEKLRAGDVLHTLDQGLVPVRYIRDRWLSADHMARHANHRPVRIAAHALGPGLPERDLLVSPQHRMLIRSAIAERMFGEVEILVPAGQLTSVPGITQPDVSDRVRYIHLLLDHHAVVLAEAAPTETMFLGQETRKMLSAREADQIEVALGGAGRSMQPARLFVRGRRLRRLLERHEINRKPLVSGDFLQQATLSVQASA